jgi:hypothetical protein
MKMMEKECSKSICLNHYIRIHFHFCFFTILIYHIQAKKGDKKMDYKSDKMEYQSICIDVDTIQYSDTGKSAVSGGGPACYWPDFNPLVILCC